MPLSDDQRAAIERVRLQAGGKGHPYCEHDYNVHRWLTAYEGNEEETAKVLRRHLNIREVMSLTSLPNAKGEDIDEEAEKYAPLTILGRNRLNDNKILLFEHSGKIDLNGVVDNIRITKFLRMKFRTMERLQQRVEQEERRQDQQSGGVLIMDLDGLSFSTNLLSVLAGPYRILWGTLFEQYPQLIQQIIIINAPKFVNLLYQTCIPFIPQDYRKKIIICSNDVKSTLLEHIDECCLPMELGGNCEMTSSGEFEIFTPITVITDILHSKPPLHPYPKASPIQVPMEQLTIPAGSFTTQKFKWNAGNQLEFFMQHDQEFTLFFFHARDDTDDTNAWREIYAGCERPALPQVDTWRWTVPHDGYYYIRYGNEKAWLFSVTVRHLIYQLDGSEKKIVTPITTFNN
nr:Cellular retinaldehyde-binding triple function domain containing protein [Haemonchus contortus]